MHTYIDNGQVGKSIDGQVGRPIEQAYMHPKRKKYKQLSTEIKRER